MKSRAMIGAAAILFVFILFFLLPAPLAASDGGIKVFIDGEEVEFAVSPVFLNNRLLVPLRAILEAVGAEITGWDQRTNAIAARKGNRSLLLIINEPIALLNGKPLKLDVPPTIINGSTMVPLRLLENFLELQIHWSHEKKAVEITGVNVVPFKRLSQDPEKLPPLLREWLENSWEELSIQVKESEDKIYVLATFGLKSTSGYRVEIKKLERTGDGIRMIIEFSEPEGDIFTLPIIERPYDLISIDPADAEGVKYFICSSRGLIAGKLPILLELQSIP